MRVEGIAGASDVLPGATDPVTAAIRSASRTTGATFDYLLRTAMRESSLNPSAAAKTSSARGLYQFIESTWLSMIKEEGAKHGLSAYASAIERGPKGQYIVRDPVKRAHILNLRDNPAISAVMAGALADRNAQYLGRVLGRPPTSGELYVAHFLGASGAKRLISLSRTSPDASAAASFPEAARANKRIFYENGGKPRKAVEVLAMLTDRHDGSEPPTTDPVANRALTQLRPTLSPAVSPGAAKSTRVAVDRLIFEHPISPGRSAFAPEDGPAFRALFRDGVAPRGPLSPAVRALWADEPVRRVATLSTAPGARADVPATASEPLDLLSHAKSSIAHPGRRTRF
jgi:hypothetical protein